MLKPWKKTDAPGTVPKEPAAASAPGDAELLERYRRGDATALDMLLERYEASLFPFLLGILKDHHQAEDALQETWCKALQNLDTIDGNHFRGWLFTVAYHQAMYCKRKSRTSTSAGIQADLIAQAACPVQQAQQREAEERVIDLLQRLSPSQQEVIRQRIFEGKRFQDIARDMDCPVNTALARMHEGLKRLRRLWGPDYV